MERLNLEQITLVWSQLRDALTPIRTDGQHAAALELLEPVWNEVGEDPQHPLGSLLSLMVERIQEYEDGRWSGTLPSTSSVGTEIVTDLFAPLREAFSVLSEDEREEVLAQAVRWARERMPEPAGERLPALTEEELTQRFRHSRLAREPQR